MGIPTVTKARVIMRPRRFRSSMIRVAIMRPVGIQDPRRSGFTPTRPAGTGGEPAAPTSDIVVIPGPLGGS